MGWVTRLGPDMAQVDYRLRSSAGCGTNITTGGDRTDESANTTTLTDDALDAQLAYRTDDSQAPLRWIGSGLAEFGIVPGEVLTDADLDAARLLMSGQDPTNKEQLVDPAMRTSPKAKLPATPLVTAIRAAADERGVTPVELFASRPAQARRWQRLERGLDKDPRHKAPVRDLAKLGRAAGDGILLDSLYDPADLARARDHAGEKVRVGNRGYDITFDTAKSFSVLVALAPNDLAAELRDAFDAAVREGTAAVENWAGYGMRGHHGGGESAERVDGTGLSGWTMAHLSARPVDDHAPDPHVHTHVALANMVKGADDGKWRTVGAGGRDVMRHGRAANALAEARLRRMLSERGVVWERDEATGAWEVAGIDPDLCDHFSKRHVQVRAGLAEAGLDPAVATSKQQKLAASRTAEAKQPDWSVAELRADWRRQARDAGYDPDTVVESAVPGRDGLTTAAMPGPDTDHDSGLGPEPDPEAIAEVVFDPETGLTAHRKFFARNDLMAAVADALPQGLDSLEQLESLTDDVLALDDPVRLNRDVAEHLSNADRYTTADIVDAELAILAAVGDRQVIADNNDSEVGFAVCDDDTITTAIAAFEKRSGFALSAEQRAVVKRLTGAGHGIDAVIGVAGAGKTTVMAAVADAYAAAGYRVAGASTAAVAAHHLQAETGIKSASIAAWTHRIDVDDGLDGIDVLVVDEASMTDDRDQAAIVAEAGETGTKLILIGDPQQLRSPGVGSTFRDVHQMVGGLELRDNRRQRDETHVRALQTWRDGGRRAALDALAQAGCIHAEATVDDTRAAMVGDWDARRQRWHDPHDAIGAHLMLAATNADVDVLNDACQAIRLDTGELAAGDGHDYRLPDGRTVTLYPHDQVMTRINDYASRDRPGETVLNGFRGIVTDIAESGDVTIQWRDHTPDGPVLRSQTMPAEYVEAGGVDLAYALTVHKAQGQTAESVTGDLTGLEPTAAYPLLTRHKDTLNVWLTSDVVEDETTRIELGEPDSDDERLRRAIDAYARVLEAPDPENLAIAEIDAHAGLLGHRPAPDQHRTNTDKAGQADEGDDPMPRKKMPNWWDRQLGALTDAELDTRAAGLRAGLQAGQRAATAHVQAIADARAGNGPAATALKYRRAQLAESVTRARMADDSQDAADDIEQQLTALRGQQRDLLNRATTSSPVELWLRGTSRARLEREAAEHDIEIRQLETERGYHIKDVDTCRGLARDAARNADVPDPAAAARALDDLDEHWNRVHTDAVIRDHDATKDLSAPDPDTLDLTRRELSATEAEQELRAERHPKMARFENRDRTRVRDAVDARLNTGWEAGDDFPQPRDAREAAALDHAHGATTPTSPLFDPPHTPQTTAPRKDRDTTRTNTTPAPTRRAPDTTPRPTAGTENTPAGAGRSRGGNTHRATRAPDTPEPDTTARHEPARPATPQWWTRPLGGLTDDELDQQLSGLRRQVQRGNDALLKQARLGDHIDATTADAAQAQLDIDVMTQQRAALIKDAQTNPAVLRLMHGTSRSELDQHIANLDADLERAHRDRAAHIDEAAQARTAAERLDLPDPDDLAAARADLHAADDELATRAARDPDTADWEDRDRATARAAVAQPDFDADPFTDRDIAALDAETTHPTPEPEPPARTPALVPDRDRERERDDRGIEM